MARFRIRSLLLFTGLVAVTLGTCLAVPAAWRDQPSGNLAILVLRPTAAEVAIRFVLLFPNVVIVWIAVRSIWEGLRRA